MKPNVIAALLLAIGYAMFRLAPAVPLPSPTPVAPVVVAPFSGLADIAQRLSKEDRQALKDAYLVLSRAVAADPESDPVFVDTAAVRRSHRAALLFVWRGVLSNQAGEVAGLREALESALAERIGTEEVPLNPTLRATTAKAFDDIAASLQ